MSCDEPGNTIHAPDAIYDALNQATVYTRNGYGQVTSIKTPAGLTTTNLYFSSGDSVNRLSSRTAIEISRTDSWTWTNGLVFTHTDPRGLLTINSWDNLQRLTSVTYPDGSTISNTYSVLDPASSKDRLGHWRYFGYNGIRQLIATTNENSVITRYGCRMATQSNLLVAPIAKRRSTTLSIVKRFIITKLIASCALMLVWTLIVFIDVKISHSPILQAVYALSLALSVVGLPILNAVAFRKGSDRERFRAAASALSLALVLIYIGVIAMIELKVALGGGK